MIFPHPVQSSFLRLMIIIFPLIQSQLVERLASIRLLSLFTFAELYQSSLARGFVEQIGIVIFSLIQTAFSTGFR